MVRDRRKISKDHIKKLGISELNGVDISGVERPLAAKINIPPLSPIENKRFLGHKRLNIEVLSIEYE